MGTAIITGASSGLGKEFFKLLVNRPNYFGKAVEIDEFYLVGRNVRALKDLIDDYKSYEGIKIRPFVCDLTQPDDLLSFCQEIESKVKLVSVLINCAGAGTFGEFKKLPYESSQSMVDLNVTALMKLTHCCLPMMIHGSRIIQVASSAAFAPLPGMSVYSATKSWVVYFSRALRAEVKDKGIKITTLCPGTIYTDFFNKAERYSRFTGLKDASFAAMPEEVARHGLRKAKSGKAVAVYNWRVKFLRLCCKIVPHSWVVAIWAKFSPMVEQNTPGENLTTLATQPVATGPVEQVSGNSDGQ